MRVPSFCGARWYDSQRMPLVTLDKITMAYGHLPLLLEASLRIESRERVCVIGRNGTGKSTLSSDRQRLAGAAERHRLARAWTAHRPAGAGCARS